jgi:hypothetical protein
MSWEIMGSTTISLEKGADPIIHFKKLSSFDLLLLGINQI